MIREKCHLSGSEACTEEMRQELERRWGILATDNYGLSEIMGPGVSGECHLKNGMHIAEDHFIVEIIDPITGEPKDYGEEGEVVITTLTKEALPIIRYRTRDISALNPEPCKCGRNSMRMRKISGRTDDMLIIRGVNVFPSQIESVLVTSKGVTPNYMLGLPKTVILMTLKSKLKLPKKCFSISLKSLKP